MNIEGDRIVLEKPVNALDELLLEVGTCLESQGIRYAVVSGYVAVLFGRARATEDIDVIVEPFDETVSETLATTLEDAGFWGTAMPLEKMYDTLSDDLPIRIAERDHRVPNVEPKFPTDRYDRRSLQETVSVELPPGDNPNWINRIANCR